MAVLMNKQKDEMILTCKCGCEAVVHIKITRDDSDYAFMSFMNGNFYRDQYGGFDLFKRKLKKIWAILANKDYCYSEIILSEEDYKEFKDYVQRAG